jgi:hypothetical protein
LEFTVLDVDQGSGNLVEVYDDQNDTVPKRVVLIDLGTHVGVDSPGPKASVEFVVSRLKAMPEPRLDAVFLSHSDEDHINLIRSVLDSGFTPPTGADPLTVCGVWYGGLAEKYVKRKFNVLAELDKYAPTKATVLHSLDVQASDYEGTVEKDWKPTWKRDGAEAWIVHANAVNEKGPGVLPKKYPYYLNAVSLIVMVTYAGRQLVTTGDATGLTLRQCNDLIKELGVKKRLDEVFALTLPHHGSKATLAVKTALSPSKYKPGELETKTVAEFVDNFRPQTISASAGESYDHPADSVIRTFSRHLTNQVRFEDPTLLGKNGLKQHFYTAHFDPKSVPLAGSQRWPPVGGWYTVRTDRNIFTTEYYKADQKPMLFIEHPPQDKDTPSPLNPTVFKGDFPGATGWRFTVKAAQPPALGDRQIEMTAHDDKVAAVSSGDTAEEHRASADAAPRVQRVGRRASRIDAGSFPRLTRPI